MPSNENPLISWIVPKIIARSPFPLSNELQTIPEQNIMLVVNLTSRGIPNSMKRPLEKQGVRFKRCTIHDFGTPSPNTIKDYLEDVCKTIHMGHAVLTHCIAGCGRTGTMIGLFLTTHGYEPTKAIKTIHSVLGEGCPETSDQIELIHQYRKKCPNFSQCKGKMPKI